MSEVIALRQGPPTVVLNDLERPTIITSVDVESVVIEGSGASYEQHIINAPVTYVTEVTEVVEPADPGDLTLLFNNHLI